jgi:predicted  nucleic acid-binding Zn-ribbon protein
MAAQRTVDVSGATRNHPLFSMLDYIARKALHNSSELQALNKRIDKVENKIEEVVDLQKELKQLMEEVKGKTFSIEKTEYKVEGMIII